LQPRTALQSTSPKHFFTPPVLIEGKNILKGTGTGHSINHKEALAETRYMLALWSLQLIEPSAPSLFFCSSA
jgi:hypothetical protein